MYVQVVSIVFQSSMYVDVNNTWQLSKGENFDFTDHDNFDETLLIKNAIFRMVYCWACHRRRRCLFRRLPSAYLLILRKMYVTHNCLKRDFLPTWTFVFSFIVVDVILLFLNRIASAPVQFRSISIDQSHL